MSFQETADKGTKSETPAAMETGSDNPATSAASGTSKEEKMDTGDAAGGEKESTATKPADTKSDPAEKKEAEPNFQMLSNPARVLPQQVRGMETCWDSLYHQELSNSIRSPESRAYTYCYYCMHMWWAWL